MIGIIEEVAIASQYLHYLLTLNDTHWVVQEATYFIVRGIICSQLSYGQSSAGNFSLKLWIQANQDNWVNELELCTSTERVHVACVG